MVKSMGGGVVLMVGHEDEDKRDNEEFIFMGFEQYNQKRKKENPLWSCECALSMVGEPLKVHIHKIIVFLVRLQ